ncbi:hypothetical protein CK203_043583 [Vitis vinifera]|uniref:DUF4216 domain-containing protein n=1 Tax=Vitis vinifera TaxID=29760 RepID=A0A438HYI1_VITVI|nr:hypothetical protein CK203_043583 [Vitis vinifera]
MEWLKLKNPHQFKDKSGSRMNTCKHLHIGFEKRYRIGDTIFNYDWVENKNGIIVDDLGFTLVDFNKIAHKSNPFILASQAKQGFYVQDQLDPRWSIVLSTPQKDFLDKEGGDDLVGNSIEHHPFKGTLLEVETFDAMDDSDAICIRGDCEGIWIENKSSM